MTIDHRDFALWLPQGAEPKAWCMTLMPERCAFHADSSTLLVADLHVGKAAVFRARGLPVPQGTTHATLARLSTALRRTQAQRLVVLGDLLHAKESHASATLLALRAWRLQHALLECWAVEGNHDRHAGALPPEFEFQTVPSFSHAHWLGVHDAQEDIDPKASPLPLVVAGHVHPVIRLKSAFETFRLPCFSLEHGILTLPAFGEFTGGHAINQRRRPRPRIFAIGESVAEIIG